MQEGEETFPTGPAAHHAVLSCFGYTPKELQEGQLQVLGQMGPLVQAPLEIVLAVYVAVVEEELLGLGPVLLQPPALALDPAAAGVQLLQVHHVQHASNTLQLASKPAAMAQTPNNDCNSIKSNTN